MKIEIPFPLICNKCKKPYGKSNTTYQGVDIWITCLCGDIEKNKIYLINTKKELKC